MQRIASSMCHHHFTIPSSRCSLWILMMCDRVAKEKKLRFWKNYEPMTSSTALVEKAYAAKV